MPVRMFPSTRGWLLLTGIVLPNHIGPSGLALGALRAL